ncbi:NF-kappa-B inhibitor zeta-like [Lampris incognitus]|uniref:NF-kappa-B inhibitor zeta-like n=1 Tax=Lampris incognitus TaxID=2546036 RepID=UPI0024B4B05E|nr:NF-kappa-B inhibitor zeta-like [Lampris incognitus]
MRGDDAETEQNCSPFYILEQEWEPVNPNSGHEAKTSETSMKRIITPIPISPSFSPPNPGIGSVNPQHKQHQMPHMAEGKMSFFQWQMQKEAIRMEGVDLKMLNMQDEDGDTCLHIAVAKGKRAVACVLAQKMAAIGSLDVKEHKGQTALHIAVATNQHLIVQDLLANGAQINMRDCWGRSPLHVCAERGHFLTLKTIHRVLTGSWQQSDTEMFNYDGLTALHTAVLSQNAVVKELTCATAPLSATVVMELQWRRRMYEECIQTLLLMGACCETRDLKHGRTSLHMAAEVANVELFRLFLEKPASLSIVNARTFSGNTALHIVSSLQSHDYQVGAVRLLVRRGADPSGKNAENDRPAQLAPKGPIGDKVRQILKGKPTVS